MRVFSQAAAAPVNLLLTVMLQKRACINQQHRCTEQRVNNATAWPTSSSAS
jgi:hypothetical protein